MITTGTHAPIVNLDTTTTMSTMPVATAPTPLRDDVALPLGLTQSEVMTDHARSGRA